MTAAELKTYLDVLPPGTFQVDLQVGDVHLKLNINPSVAPAHVQPQVPGQDVTTGDVVTADDPVGQAFPQLIGKRHADLGGAA